MDHQIMFNIALMKNFSKNLDLPVESWNPFDSLKFSEGVDEKNLKKNISRLGVSLGLALYQI